MHFFLRAMNQQDANAIATWHYEPPYDFYDFAQDPEDLAELLDSANWGTTLRYAVTDEHDTLVGFFSFTPQEDALEIGLGLRPDLTGQGSGTAFLEAGLAYAREHLQAGAFSLRVATFNQRAIKTYERTGFVAQKTYMQKTNGSEFEFLQMLKSA
jgi:ribosomal-protein-alanine N-acetyltransferase